MMCDLSSGTETREQGRCSTHGDQIIDEPGGPDQVTAHGRRYCPTCQRLLMAALDKIDGKVVPSE